MFAYSKYKEYKRPNEVQKNLLYRVVKPEQMPKGEHFAILGLYQSSHSEPGYDAHESSYTVTNDVIEYWVCANEEVWKDVISEFYIDQAKHPTYSQKESIIPLKVAGVGQVTTEVKVKIG